MNGSWTYYVLIRAMVVLAIVVAPCTNVHPADKKATSRSTTITNDSYCPFLINSIFNYYGNNGAGSFNPHLEVGEGFEFPKGSGKFVIFGDGLVWGGYHKGRTVAKVGGSVYRHALQPGPLVTSGTPTTDPVPADPGDPKYRIYRVRPDVRPDIPFTAVETKLNADEVLLIVRYQPVTARGLYDQYVSDWTEWPASLGAPFTDVDRNGVYDPTVDIPGQPGADQTLWYVANDMNDSLTQRLAGCPPIGLEMQRTMWGYRREGALASTIFVKSVIINKSGAPVDSMYLAQWEDPDLGNPGNNLVGCDTVLDMGYVYSGGEVPNDVFGTAVPAGGTAILQGPIIPGGLADTAVVLGSFRSGCRNLRMTAFSYFRDGPAEAMDPAQGREGDVQWYRILTGIPAQGSRSFVDPLTGDTTTFCVSGDPVRSTDGGAGWVDGMSFSRPKDRRMCMSMGPCTLADGDTQEVVVAFLASQGTDRLSSITALRADLRSIRDAFRSSILGRSMPTVSYSVTPESAQASVSFRLDARSDRVVGASIRLATSADEEIAVVPLADDGSHSDALPGDGIWGGTVSTRVRSTGLKADAILAYPGGTTMPWRNVLDHIATARLTVGSFSLVSDNINSDGIANPGENVRYVFELKNDSHFDLPGLSTHPIPFTDNGSHIIPTLQAHAAFHPQYDANDASSYFSFDLPTEYPDSTVHIAIVTTDDSLNVWRDTLVFPVKPMPAKVQSALVRHVAGKASGAFAIQVVDPARVKGHLYVLRGVDSADAVGSYMLKDSTTGVVLIPSHPIPDALGHTSPVVDGFKVLRGTIDVHPGMRSWTVPSGTRRFSPIGGFTSIGLEGFTTIADTTAYDTTLGTIGAAMNLRFGGIGTSLKISDYHTVLLKLAAADNANLWDPRAVPTDTNFSRAYRYLRAATSAVAQPSFAPWIINRTGGYAYQDYDHSVPFSAWDMDVEPPVRLAVGHLENNVVAGLVDGRYWPGSMTVDNSVAREFAFIFRSPYIETPDPAFMVNLSNNATTPLMWVMTCARRTDDPWVAGDEFLIIAHHFPTSEDAWVFSPSVVTSEQQGDHATAFALLQNYPNPFNPTTTIRYDLPAQSEVTITVYDVLGRAVRHLVRDVQPAGSHALVWQGDNDAGQGVASGVYFYRYTATRSDRSACFEQTMKMILLR